MEAETVLNLLDSYWYNLNFFKRKPSSPKAQPNPDHKIPEKPSSNQEIPTLPSIHTKSPQNSQLRYDSASPNSVLFNSKLQTIVSGKEFKDFADSMKHERETQETPTKTTIITNTTTKGSSSLKGSIGIRKKKRGISKSLSDLEFEELKGFEDLGFVFSEEDKDSNLASIIPGLQRLGKKLEAADSDNKGDNNGDESKSNAMVSRPYLSEAWEVLERKRREKNYSLLKNWRVPDSNSEVDIKDYLRFWAHSVASTVR